MERIFRKQKMIDRLAKEGRLNQVRAEDYELMDKLDGHKANDYNNRIYEMIYGTEENKAPV